MRSRPSRHTDAMLLDEPIPMTTHRLADPQPPAQVQAPWHASLHTPTPSAPSLGDVVARIGAEVSGPLTLALDRVMALASTGRIDRSGLQALRSEIDLARRVGLRGQQIARLAGGDMRQSVERLDLPQCLRAALHGQPARADDDAIAMPPAGTPAEVLGDATLVHALLGAAAAWSGALARAGVDWRVDLKPWPVRARVTCHFAHVPADHAGPRQPRCSAAHHEATLDTMDWLLLRFTAHMAGVLVQREDSPSHTQLTLEFLHTVNGTLEGATAVDLMTTADGGAPSIAGCQMLVLASQRSTRQRLREAVQGQDLLIDHVSTVDDARQYCRDGAPQLLVFESAFHGDALGLLLADLGRTAPGAVLVEVLPAGQDCELSATVGTPVTRLGIDALRHMLLPVLVLEMGRANTA
jgi:hypothetical protein